MTGPLVVDVIGVPAPQGSKRHVGRGILIESSKAVAPWRTAVAYATRNAVLDQTHDGFPTGPVHLHATFYLPRPSTAPKRRLYPDRRPDLDKLLRSTLDGLGESAVFGDDAQVVQATIGKRYATPGHPTGARLILTTAADLDP